MADPGPHASLHQGSFQGGTRGNAILIVKVCTNALLTALRTIFWPNMWPDCEILRIQSQKFPGWYPRHPQEHSDPDTKFRLARQRSCCSFFTKWPLLFTDQRQRWYPDRLPKLFILCAKPYMLNISFLGTVVVSGRRRLLRSQTDTSC